MSNIVWVASFPRAGSMYLRFLLANLFFGGIESSAAMSAAVPDMHSPSEIRIRNVPDAAFSLCKTHFVLTRWLLDQDQFRTVGGICLVRNPIDVMASVVNFVLLRTPGIETCSDDERERVAANTIDTFLKTGTLLHWLRDGFGTWDSHAVSWLMPVPLPGARDVPHLMIRFEDLRADPAAELSRVCAFLGQEKSDEEIAGAVARSTFERTAAIEEREFRDKIVGEFYRPEYEGAMGSGLRQVFKGRVGYGRDQFTAEQLSALKFRFGPVAAMLGYDL